MKQYTWVEPEILKQVDEIELWSKQFGIHAKLVPLLWNRGILTFENAKNFFTPSTSNLHNPFLMADMQKAVDRLVLALDTNQKILVYGDYDVDGTTAVAMVYSFLKSCNAQVIYYVPDRYNEGYGVSIQGMDYAIQHSCNLIITLDCGIKAHRAIEYVTQAGIDVIVCDHHEPGETLPPAYAVLDPKRDDCNYPFKELSGCGVGYKFLYALCEQRSISIKENLNCYMDLLAISIASDIVPIVDENRVLIYFGLLKIMRKPHLGIKAITETSGMFGPITVSDVVFKIGPRINAAGRMYNAKTVIELLISDNYEKAVDICKQIQEYNISRRAIDKSITDEALAMLKNDEQTFLKKTNVLYKPSWHKGVIGIVASRVLEQYYKPTVIFCGEGDIISASARSVAEFDLYKALEQCSDLLVNYGGHTFAAGMSMEKQYLPQFIERFETIVSQTITEDALQPKILIDAELNIDDITLQLYEDIMRFAPFGPQNMTPVFMIRGLCDTGKSKIMGNDQSHVKLELMSSGKSTKSIEAIGFGLAHTWKQISKTHNKIDICFTIREHEFRNIKSLQLELRDIRPHIDYSQV
jgi:single-stranded-DNA-specific exonuclease